MSRRLVGIKPTRIHAGRPAEYRRGKNKKDKSPRGKRERMQLITDQAIAAEEERERARKRERRQRRQHTSSLEQMHG